MKKFQLSAINNPSIEIECGGVVMSTNKIKNAKKNPNFDSSSLFFDVVRPREHQHLFFTATLQSCAAIMTNCRQIIVV